MAIAINAQWVRFRNYNNGVYEVSSVNENVEFGIPYGVITNLTTNDIYVTFKNNESIKSFLMAFNQRGSVGYFFMSIYMAERYIDIASVSPTNIPRRARKIKQHDASMGWFLDITSDIVEEIKQKGLIITGTYRDGSIGLNFSNTHPVYNEIVEYPPPTIENLVTIGDNWERSIEVSWRSTGQLTYEYELYQDNIKIGFGSGATETRFVIPPNTFKNTLPASVRVRVKSSSTYSSWVERALTLKDIEATISNLLVEGDKWEKPIKLSWLSTDQQQYKIEVFKSNVLQHTFTGATAKEHTMPKDILSSGDYVFKVWVGYANRFVNYQTDNVTLTDIVATVGKVAVSGSNIDLPISVSWDSTDQEKYTLEVLQNSVVTHTFTGTTAKAHTIQAGTLNVGLTEFRVKVAYKDRWTEYANTSTSLVETLPSISILEPDGRIVQRDEPLRVWWTSQNQTSWKLTVDRATEYTGTTTKEYIIQAGTLTIGRHEITLEVTLVIAGKTKKTYKTVEFIVQGKPPIPTITSGAIFTTNRPIFAWDSQDATAYQVEVLGVYASGWLNGGDNTHKIANYLPNGNYTVIVRVKNQFNIVSDEAVQQITINAVVPQAIALKVYDNYSYNVLRWVATGYERYYIFRNDEMIGVSYSDRFTDYTAQWKNVYRVQGVTSTDAFRFSNDVVAFTELDYPIISIGATMLEMKYSTSKVELNGSYSTMESKEYYAGRKQPISRYGEHEDINYRFDYSEFTEENYTKLLDMVKLKQPILYRSKKHKLWLAFNSVGFVDNSMVIDYSINAYVIDTNEGIKYD